MAIIRLREFQCDVLVTLNTELDALKPHAASAAPSLYMGADEQLVNELRAEFDEIAGSLRHSSREAL